MGIIVRGSELIGTNNAGAAYVSNRPLQLLKDLGAVTADQAAVLDRADKIQLGNRNEAAEAKEVANLFREDVFGTLFPEEQAVLPQLWNKFLVNHADFPTPELTPLAVEAVPGHVGAIDPDKPFAISELPQELQRIARRVQLTIDCDRQPPTIQYNDILAALTSPNSEKYTDGELVQIGELKRRFLEEILPRGVEAPSIVVPALGQHKVGLATFAGVTAELVTKTSLTAQQYQSVIATSSTVRAGGTIDVSNRLLLQREAVAVQIAIPAGHRLVVISNDGQRIHDGAQAILKPAPGPYILELYDAAGHKVDDGSFELPDANQLLELTAEHLGKTVLGADGQTFEPQLTEFQADPIAHNGYSSRSDYRTGTRYSAQWTFVPAGTAAHTGDVAAAQAAFTWSGGSLKDGAYGFNVDPGYRTERFGTQSCVLEKFPGPCFAATLNGEKLWLLPYGPSNYSGPEYNGRRLFRSFANRLEVTFEPATNKLSVTRWPSSGSEGHWEHVVSDADFSETGNP